MSENKTGGKPGKKGLAAIIGGGAVVVLAGVYLFLCYWAGGHVLPNHSVGGVELGGLQMEQVAVRLQPLEKDIAGEKVYITCDGQSVECDMEKAQPKLAMDRLCAELTAEDEAFLLRGAEWIGALFSDRQVSEGIVSFGNNQYVDDAVMQLQKKLDGGNKENEYEVSEEKIVITRGEPGMLIDPETALAALQKHLVEGNSDRLEVTAHMSEVEEFDFAALLEQVQTEPADATLDPETFEVIPHVNGMFFDVKEAEKLFAAAKDGESFELPLVITEPETTTEELQAILYADVLGQATSWISGTANRLSNVKLAGRLCDDTVLLPGDEFSYWSKIAPCNAAQGFLPAPTYLKGDSVDGVGGGICQMSSSIYYAAFHANLEVVERNHHSFAVGYLPDGGDAMVSEGWSDFRFVNNTEYPIKIKIFVSGRNLTVQILGTKTDDTYVKMEAKRLSTTEYKTVYEVDPKVPVGTTKVDVTPYTGRKVQVYRCVYDGTGKLISRTFESMNNYKVRDQVILVNPADAYKYGLDENGNPLPEGTPAPGVTPTPAPTPTPDAVPTPTPGAEPTPTPGAEPTPTPTPTPAPTPTPTPAPTPTPTPPPAPDPEGGEPVE